MRKIILAALFLTATFPILGGSPPPPAAAPRTTVDAVLNDFHQAAARADEARYFSHFAADAVFIGTDPEERWTVPAFREYAHPYFSKGKGWTFVPRARNISFSADGKTAWFDEALDSTSYGVCRGTGVLQLIAGEWKVEQYNLSIPIPNDMAKDFVSRIRDHGNGGAPKKD